MKDDGLDADEGAGGVFGEALAEDQARCCGEQRTNDMTCHDEQDTRHRDRQGITYTKGTPIVFLMAWLLRYVPCEPFGANGGNGFVLRGSHQKAAVRGIIRLPQHRRGLVG